MLTPMLRLLLLLLLLLLLRQCLRRRADLAEARRCRGRHCQTWSQ